MTNAATRPSVHIVVPGALSTPTGGFVYDRYVVRGLRQQGFAVTVHELPAGWPDPGAGARAAAAEIFETLPGGALVVVDGLAFGVLPDLAAAHGARLRLVALVHHPLSAETHLDAESQHALMHSERAALAHARHIITTSGFTADALLDFGVTAPHLTVIPPGVTPAAQAAGSRGPGLVLLCVGAVIPRKGHDVLLNALAGLTHYHWQLDIAGSETLAPHHAAAMRRLAKRLNLDTRVTFQGACETGTLEALYARSDIFVLASHYEGYGMVLTEAAARGLPIVATAGGAVPFTLPEGSGLLAPSGDIAGLRATLARILNETGLHAELKAGAQKAAQRLPTWPHTVAHFAQTLKTVAG